MRDVAIMARLFARPALLFQLFGVVSIGFVLGFGSMSIEAAREWWSLGGGDAQVRVMSTPIQLFGVILVTGSALLGTLYFGALIELLTSPNALGLPALRTHMARTQLKLALSLGLVFVVISWFVEGESWFPIAGAEAVFWFVLGGVMTDPFGMRRWAWPSFALLLAVLAVQTDLRAAAQAAPWLAMPLLLAATWLVWRGLWSLDVLRVRMNTPAYRLSWELRSKAGFYGQWIPSMPLQSSESKRVRLRGRGIGAWIGAARQECFGWSRIGGVGFALLLAIGATVIMVGIAYLDSSEHKAAPVRALEYVYRLLFDPQGAELAQRLRGNPPFEVAPVFFGCAAALHALSGNFLLQQNLIYPLSRRQRAAVAFRGSLLDNAIWCVITTALLSLIGLLVARFLSLEPFPSVPLFLRTIVVCFLLMPIVQYVRARMLETWNKRLSGMMIGISILVGLFGGAVAALVDAWRDSATDHVWLELGLFAVAAVVVQLAYRLALQRVFARKMLV